MGVWIGGKNPSPTPYARIPPSRTLPTTRGTPGDAAASSGLSSWASRAGATCAAWGLARSTASAHRTVVKQFWHFIHVVAQCSFDEFAADATQGLCAFAEWCYHRPKSCSFGPLKAGSVEQYVGSLVSSLRIKHCPLKFDRKFFNFYIGALRRKETHTVGAPTHKKAPLTADMLDCICSSGPYARAAQAIDSGRPFPPFSARDANTVCATAAACYALATANRASSLAAPSTIDFNPLVHATRGDLAIDDKSFRYTHKPTKNDKDGSIWRGPSPRFPTVPTRACCPHKALRIRDALFPSLRGPCDPLFPYYSRSGAVTSLTCKAFKTLAMDKMLHLAPTGSTSISARVGHATAAFSAGASADTIKQFGKWKSDTWRVYARVTDKTALAHVHSVFA